MTSVQLVKVNDPWRLAAIFLIVLLTSSLKSVPFSLATSSGSFGFLSSVVVGLAFALSIAVIYPGLLVVGVYLIGRGLAASKRAVVTVLLVASVVGEFAFFLPQMLNELPVPPSAIWSMPAYDLASMLSPVLDLIVLEGPVTFFLAIGALALSGWLKTMKKTHQTKVNTLIHQTKTTRYPGSKQE